MYNKPDRFKSIWQIFNTFIPYLLVWYLMIESLKYSYWITLLLSVVASAFLIRIFIIFHDCGHGSFFKSPKVSNAVGIISGILAFTPYHMWHHHHKIHHATSANLDKRGIGDVWTMTKEEFISAPAKTKRFYRIFRNPFIMFIIGPLYVIFFQNRVPKKNMTKQEKKSVYITDAAIVLIAVAMSLIFGLKNYLMIQLPVIFLAHSVGIWLFLIQHNFEDVEWERTDNWDYKTAALEGSSFLKLPAIFQWFTGNIGYHHVHHLSPRIPNYNLERCHNENEMFRDIKPIYFLSTFRFLKLQLWDEKNQKMISFSALRQPVYA
jgi:omega-6 fatty acid desaturase (delta-12 desaturase)